MTRVGILTSAAVLILAAAPAARAGDGVDLQQFKPAPGTADVLAVESARVGNHLEWNAIAAIHYANAPMRLVNQATGDVAATVLGHQTAADVGGAVGWRERYELGVMIPITVNQASGAANRIDPRISGNISENGIGDVRLVPKALLFQRDGGSLGVSLPISLPTASRDGLHGHTGGTVRPRVLIDVEAPAGISLVGNVGVALRSPERFVNFKQGTALEYGAGAIRPFRFKGYKFAAVATLGGEFGLTDAGTEERPAELLLGLRTIGKDLTVTFGAGPGLSRGAGTPDYRMFLTVARTLPRVSPVPIPPRGIEIDRSTLRLANIDAVYFATDDDLIEQRSFPALTKVAQFLVKNPWIRGLRVEGHSDNEGDDLYNLNLSQLRAISIMRFLVQNGVEPDVLEARGYGLTRPVDTNATPEGRARNRRVEFVILRIDEALAPDWAKSAIVVPPAAPSATPAP